MGTQLLLQTIPSLAREEKRVLVVVMERVNAGGLGLRHSQRKEP